MRKLLIGLVGLVLLVLALGFGYIRSSLPQLDGTVTLAGISDTITIHRDQNGVPHINAADRQDLYFATGFVHAQDRLWQMEMNRRIGHGRVSEILGKDALTIDKVMRTYGFTHKARAALETMSDEGRAHVEAYAAGVNAFLDARRGALPPEFLILGVTPEPWQPLDTLVWSKLMWLDLSGNMRFELARARLLTKLSPQQVQTLYPTYPGEAEEDPLPALADLYAALPLDAMLATFGEPRDAAHGSNNWVISGAHTETGAPMLANDPHLGLTTPSIWYLVHQHDRGTGKSGIGVSFPGAPGIVLGRNSNTAWGFTNTATDVQDLFIEKLIGDSQYLTPDGPQDLRFREEVITVKGEDPHTLTVRETRHGPIISDALPPHDGVLSEGYALALQWTALMDRDPFVDVMQRVFDVEDFDGFRDATQIYMGPEQNMIFADTSGAIGYTSPGLAPVRKAENLIKGRLPSPGWDARYDWDGFLPYEAMPLRDNPESGTIATANERIVPFDYPHYLTRDWTVPYRGNRIRERLASDAPHSLASMADIQNDVISDYARSALPALMALIPAESPARAVFADWDGSMARDNSAALLFQVWQRRYWEALIADELGPDLFARQRSPRPRLLISTLAHAAGPDAIGYGDAYYDLPLLDAEETMAWCDNISTQDAVETCDGLASETLAAAYSELQERFGADATTWRWDNLHQLTQTHRPFSNVPSIADYFHITTGQGGATYTVNVAGVSSSPDAFLTSTMGPSYRGIFDLSDLENSLYAQPTGQSGNPLSAHHKDLFHIWNAGDYVKIPTVLEDSQIAHTLVLEPQ